MKQNKLFFLLAIIFFCLSTSAQNSQESLAEKLGYPENSKMLIIHADDAGVSHSENIATIRGLEEGVVNSSSIMVPCPWFPEIATYAKKHADSADFGLHLTVTSEWKDFKWGSTSSKNEVQSLINHQGYFYPLVDSVVRHGKAIHVEKEIEAQIQKAISFGIDITHLDAHMGAVMSTPEFLKAYIKKGREYEVPVLLNREIPALREMKDFEFTEKDVFVDSVYQAYPEVYNDKAMDRFYEDILNNLQPGLSCILIHLAVNNEEMMAVTKEHPYWGSQWRQNDLDFFTGEKVRKLLEKNDIILVTWREIRDKIVRSK